MSVASNIIFDPSRDELAVADSVLALSVGQNTASSEGLKILAIRTIDPPSRLTNAGTPIVDQSTTSTSGNPSIPNASSKKAEADTFAVNERSREEGGSVWRAPRGGVKRSVIGRVIKMVIEKGGVAEEVLEALEGVET